MSGDSLHRCWMKRSVGLERRPTKKAFFGNSIPFHSCWLFKMFVGREAKGFWAERESERKRLRIQMGEMRLFNFSVSTLGFPIQVRKI